MIETLTVKGMKCGGCENTVTTTLQALDGITNVKAAFKLNEVQVEFDESKIDLSGIKSAIQKAGFSVD